MGAAEATATRRARSGPWHILRSAASLRSFEALGWSGEFTTRQRTPGPSSIAGMAPATSARPSGMVEAKRELAHDAERAQLTPTISIWARRSRSPFDYRAPPQVTTPSA